MDTYMISYQIIVLAAGQGKRMRASQNKQFIELGQKPLIIHTLDVFQKDSWCQSIKLVVNPTERDTIQELVNRFSFQEKVELVNGGQERQHSVFNGLEVCRKEAGIVLIHDGARPFIDIEHIHKLVMKAQRDGAALLAVPVTDTIKSLEHGQLTTLDRRNLWAAQTPQAFQFEVIYDAHKEALENHYLGTDDTSLVERMGRSVAIVEGSYDNIKLTTPEDLEKANAILAKRELD